MVNFGTLSVAAHTQTVWSSLRRLDLYWSHLERQGERLDEQQAKDVFKQLCPQAQIELDDYEVNVDTDCVHTISDSFPTTLLIYYLYCCIL